MDELFFWPSILCALNARSMDAWLRLLLLTILFLIEAIRLCFMIRIIGSPFASPVMMPKQPQKMVVLAIEDVQVGGGANLWHPEHLTALMVALTRLGNWRGGVYFMALYHLRALQVLYLSGEISRETMKTVRGQVLSSKNEAEMEQILQKVIKNVGIRHKKARQGV